MIKFNGHEKLIEEVYKRQQEHVFAYWDDLSHDEKTRLLNQLESIDFDLMEKLFRNRKEQSISQYSPVETIRPEDFAETKRKEAKALGEAHIKEGKLAAFLVAGGQGSRLGFDGPKGKFPIGSVSGKSLFHFHSEKIKAAEIKYRSTIPFIIMTSPINHAETVDFFKDHKFFGLNSDHVFIFPQKLLPSMDMKGKLIMESRSALFMNPDGHGGSLNALKDSGVLTQLTDMGIETISYFQVDNPLVKITDSQFIGFHLLEEAEMSSKAIPKAYPEEKTGVFIKTEEGKRGIIEYSDMPEEKLQARDSRGDLLYSAGNTAIHLISLSFIAQITDSHSKGLPFHRAVKKIEAFQNGGVATIDGLKYEKFIFDALPLCRKDMVYQTVREEEFAPVKNASGKDSPESAEKLISNLHRKWLINAGVTVPETTEVVEISPLFSLNGEDIPPLTEIPETKEVYIEPN